ncbi:tsuA [Symbiodinium sp. CCMP2592]|nr:tsuA [Symbiodinium sp. CCMP2592]
MDPATLHAAVCRADADDPRLLGRRSVGKAKNQEKLPPEEPLLRPGRAKVLQEVKVRAAKCKESEILGLLREGMFVTIHEVCTKSAHVEYGLTGLVGWVTLRRNSEPVLKEDPWSHRPPVKKVPKASEPPPEPEAFETVNLQEPLLRPGRAKVLQEVEVRAAKCKESEIIGLLREGMFVTIHEVCTKSAHVEYGLTGLVGWVTLRRNSEPVLKEDPWAFRPAVKRVPQASEPPPEPEAFETVNLQEPLLRPGRAKVLQEVEVRAAKCEESEILGLLREGMFVTIHEVCTKSAHVEYGLTGLVGWVTLRRNSEPVLKEDPWAFRPAVKRVPQASEPPPEPEAFEKVNAKLAAARPCNKAAGSSAGDHRSLPEPAWTRIHDRFQAELANRLLSKSQSPDVENVACRAEFIGDHRSLPETAWLRIHERFRGEPVHCSQFQDGEAITSRPTSSLDQGSLRKSAWKRIQDTWKSIRNRFQGEAVPCKKSSHSPVRRAEVSTGRADCSGDHRSLPEAAWKVIHDRFRTDSAPCMSSTRDVAPVRAYCSGDHRSLPEAAWKVIHDRFRTDSAPCMSSARDVAPVRAYCSGDHRSLPEAAWKVIHDRFRTDSAPCMSSTRDVAPVRAYCSGDHRSLPEAAWKVIHGRFRTDSAHCTSSTRDVAPVRAYCSGDYRSLPEAAWKGIHDRFHTDSAPCMFSTRDVAPVRADCSGDHRSLPEAAWKVIHDRFRTDSAPCMSSTRDVAPVRAYCSGDHRTLPEAAWKVIHDRFRTDSAPCMSSTRDVAPVRAYCSGDHRSLPEAAWKVIHDRFRTDSAPCLSSTEDFAPVRADCSGDHRCLPEAAWKLIVDRFHAHSAPCMSSTQDFAPVRAYCSCDHRTLPEAAWKVIHDRFRTDSAPCLSSPEDFAPVRADCSGDHRSLPEAAWKRIHDQFEGPCSRPSSTAVSDWWMAFWHQAVRDLCCSR